MIDLEKLRTIQVKNNSWLCVGLDPDPARLRVDVLKWDEPVLPFNRAIIDATADLVWACKTNLCEDCAGGLDTSAQLSTGVRGLEACAK